MLNIITTTKQAHRKRTAQINKKNHTKYSQAVKEQLIK